MFLFIQEKPKTSQKPNLQLQQTRAYFSKPQERGFTEKSSCSANILDIGLWLSTWTSFKNLLYA